MVVVGVLAAGLAAPALGDTTDGKAGGVVYRSDSTAIGPPDSVVIEVACPGNKHASGAGFGTVSTLSGPVNRSVPTAGGDGWSLMRADDPGGPPGTSLAYAICDSKRRAYRAATRRIPDTESRTVKARCGRSQHVSGGGAVLLGAPVYGEIESTYPFDGPDRGRAPDDGWAVRASNLDHQSRRLKVTAVCTSARLRYRSETAELAGGGYNAFTPECRRRHLVGLGARIDSPPDESLLENLLPGEGADSDDAPDDYALGDGSSDAASGTMKVFGICR
jgi:hypothetical protein